MSEAHLDRTMMALADPTRRAILRRLSRSEARVTELAKPFNISLNAVSKHIRILERALLVHRRREGREHVLTANIEPLGEAVDWIQRYRRMWHERFDRLDDLLRELQREGSSREYTKKQSRGKNNGRKK